MKVHEREEKGEGDGNETKHEIKYNGLAKHACVQCDLPHMCVRLGVNTFWLCAFVCFNVVKNQTLCECVRIFV